MFFWLFANEIAQSYLIESYTSSAIGEMQGEIVEIEFLVERGNAQLKQIAQNSETKLMDWSVVEDYFQSKVMEGPFQKIGLVYLDKSYHITNGNELRDLSDRDYIETVLKGNSVISSPVYSKSDGMYQVVIAEPIYANGWVVGAVIGTILMGDIESSIYTMSINNKGHGFLVDIEGNILLHPQIDRFNADDYNYFTHLGDSFKDNKNFLRHMDQEGSEHFVFYQQLNRTKWYAAIEIDKIEFMEPIMSLLSKMSLLILGVLIFLLLGINFIINGFTKAIQNLITVMRTVEQGDYTLQIPINRKDEVGEIAQQFNKTIEAISYRDEELQAFNEELSDSFQKINEANEKLTKAYEEISYNYQQQKTINQLAEKLYQVKGLESLLQAILVHTQEILSAERAAVFFYDSSERSFKVKAHLNYEDKELPFMTLMSDEKNFKWVMENSEVRIIDHLQQDNYKRFKLESENQYEMMMYLPILDEQENVIGFITYFSNKLNVEYTPILKQISRMISITVQNEQLITNEKETYFEIIVSLVKSMDLKDPYTKGHSERVMNYSLMLGKHLNLPKIEMDSLKHGSILHDIGKLGIPDEILLKQGKLNSDEFDLIKSHSIKGATFINNLRFLQPSLPIIRNHHERYDGKGYPDGLKGDEISLVTRIVTIVDAYDAMTSKRGYRKELSKQEAIEELKNNRGTQFDPYLVDQFIDVLNHEKGFF